VYIVLLFEMATKTATSSKSLVTIMERGNTVQKAAKHPLADVPEGKLGNYFTCPQLSLFVSDM
jgi:hypothetical protein